MLRADNASNISPLGMMKTGEQGSIFFDESRDNSDEARTRGAMAAC